MKTFPINTPGTLRRSTEIDLEVQIDRLRNPHRVGADPQTLQELMGELIDLVAQTRAAQITDAKQRILGDPLSVLAINAVLRQLVGWKLNDEQARYIRAIGTTTTPGSTYLVDRIGGELYDILAARGAWATLGVRPVRTKTGKFPVTTAIPDAAFISEASPMPDATAITGASFSAETGVVGILLNVSQQLSEDLDADLAPDFIEKFERSFNARVDHAVFAGTGVDDGNNGGNTGLFVDASIPSVVAATGNTTVQALDFEDFMAVLDTAPAGVLQRGAAWWMNPALLVKAMRVNDASGASIVHLETTPQGPRFFILGYPVHLVAAAPSANSASKKVAIFGDPSGYVVAVRQAFELEASGHFRWDYFQRTYRGIGRVRGVLRAADAFVALVTAAT